jgi:hypothetical protein
MNLVIVAPLVEPPTEPLYFRYVTLVSDSELDMDVLLEVEQAMKDAYYRYMCRQGLMDYVQAFVTPIENEPGVRLDTQLNFPLTVRVNAIRSENVVKVIGQVKCLTGI